MSFPTVLSITETAFPTITTAHNVAMPATVNAGDLLVVLFANDDDSTVTTPSGWTLLATSLASTVQRLSIYTKTAVGNEDGTTVDFVTSAAEKAAAQVYRATDWGDIEISTAGTGTSVNPDSPSFNPSGWDVEDTLWLTVESHANGREVSSYPTDYTDGLRTRSSADEAEAALVASARRENAVASENPGVFTIATSSQWAAFTIAIRPVVPINKAFSDAGAEGGETFVKAVQVSKAFSDAGPGGAESFALAKLKAFSDAGAEGAEAYHLTKHKSVSDAGAEGAETFSKTRFINPVYLKDRFEAIIIKVLDS